MKDPDYLPPACRGIDVVITTANSARRGGSDTVAAVDLDGNRNLINAAREAGVQPFIFLSAYEADFSHPVPFLQAKAPPGDYAPREQSCYTILAAARRYGMALRLVDRVEPRRDGQNSAAFADSKRGIVATLSLCKLSQMMRGGIPWKIS